MRVMALMAGATLALAGLSGCGGGGGGSGSGSVTPAPPPVAVADPAAPLSLAGRTAEQLADIASAGPRASETLLMVGRFAVDAVTSFGASAQPARLTDLCYGESVGNCVAATLADRDGNGRASAGDTVTTTAKDSWVFTLASAVTGTVNIEVLPGTDLAAGVVKARVSIADGLQFAKGMPIGSHTSGARTVRGAFNVNSSKDALGWSMHVMPAAEDNVRIEIVDSGKTYRDALRGFDISKTVSFSEPRIRASLRLRYDSELLGGSINLTTPETILSYLDTTPDQGSLAVSGAAGDAMVLRPVTYPHGSTVHDGFSIAVNGANLPASPVAWDYALSGALWSAEAFGPHQWWYYSARPYLEPDNFALTPSCACTVPVTHAITLQLSRDLSNARPIQVRFKDRGSHTYPAPAAQDIDAVVSRNGGRWLIAPVKPLRYDNDYTLAYSADGASWSDGIDLQDSAGNLLMHLGPPVQFTTEPALRVVVGASGTVLQSAGDALTLDAAASVDDAQPIASYHWTQLSGTPLHIGSPDAASTVLNWGGQAPSALEIIPVRLTVTDAAGTSQQKDTAVVAAHLASDSQVMYTHGSATLDATHNWGQAAAFTNLGGSFVLTESGNQLKVEYFYGPGQPVTLGWTMVLQPANGAPVAVGDYADARASPQPGQDGFSYTPVGGGSCRGAQVRVRDLARDAAGKVARLALDFEQYCASYQIDVTQQVPFFGSLRINSTTPLPP